MNIHKRNLKEKEIRKITRLIFRTQGDDSDE